MKKSIIATLLAAVTLLTLTSCSKKVDTTKILIGNSGGPRPYAYIDPASNTYVGYDRDVIAAIDELLPEYTFEFEVTDFPSIFTGINAGRYQMGVNNITKKPEREAQWLFGKEPYSFNGQVILVKKGRTDINSLEDLAGKKVYAPGTGLFSDIFFDTFNKTHTDNPIQTTITAADSTKTLQDLADGVVDFAFNEYWGLNVQRTSNPELLAQLDVIKLADSEASQIEDPLAWYIFPKADDGQKLADAVDGAIRTLKTNGKLKELAVKWFGSDGLPDFFG